MNNHLNCIEKALCYALTKPVIMGWQNVGNSLNMKTSCAKPFEYGKLVIPLCYLHNCRKQSIPQRAFYMQVMISHAIFPDILKITLKSNTTYNRPMCHG